MKKIISILLIGTLLIVVFGCKKAPKEDAFPSGPSEPIQHSQDKSNEKESNDSSTDKKPEVEQSPEKDKDNTVSTQTEPTQNKDNGNDNIPSADKEVHTETTVSDTEPIPYSNVDDLLNSINEKQAPKGYEGAFKEFSVSDIEYFYYPTAEFEGYELKNIVVSKWNIGYYYVPLGKKDSILDEQSSIIVQYRRAEKSPYKSDIMENLAADMKAELTEDGLVYRPEINQIWFCAGNSTMYINYPDSMDSYELLKPLCVANKATPGKDESQKAENKPTE